jgi:hypothetical protein
VGFVGIPRTQRPNGNNQHPWSIWWLGRTFYGTTPLITADSRIEADDRAPGDDKSRAEKFSRETLVKEEWDSWNMCTFCWTWSWAVASRSFGMERNAMKEDYGRYARTMGFVMWEIRRFGPLQLQGGLNAMQNHSKPHVACRFL